MKICNLKIDVSCEASVNFQHIAQNATTATEFAPCRLDAALPMRFTKNTQHDTSKVLRLPRKMTMDTSKVLHLLRNLPRIFAKRRKSIAPTTQNDFRHVTERCWMSRSATPATRNEATTHWKPPKMTTSAELPIGTAIRSSYERLWTVANGCGRLRPQTQRRANTPSTPRPPEHTLNPQTPRVKREPLLRIREKDGNCNAQLYWCGGCDPASSLVASSCGQLFSHMATWA